MRHSTAHPSYSALRHRRTARTGPRAAIRLVPPPPPPPPPYDWANDLHGPLR